MTFDEMKERGAYEVTILSFKPMFELMRERDITELQLSKMIGEKVNVIRKIQLQQETTPLSVIKKICHALDCNPGDLMVAEKAIYIPANKESPDE